LGRSWPVASGCPGVGGYLDAVLSGVLDGVGRTPVALIALWCRIHGRGLQLRCGQPSGRLRHRCGRLPQPLLR
jgi:hypothetical protein